MMQLRISGLLRDSALPVRSAAPLVLLSLGPFLAFGTRTLAAQAVAVRPAEAPSSRIEIFGSYGYLNPTGANSQHYLIQPGGSLANAGVAGYFTRFLGVEAEGSVSGPGHKPCSYNAQAGLRLRLPLRSFVPYVHVLGGGSKLGGQLGQPCTWGWGITAGAGLDYVLPIWREHLAARLFQVDYVYSHVTFPQPEPGLETGALARVSTGLVLRSGSIAPPTPELISCPAEPADILAGDTISVTAAAGANPRRSTFAWTASGGRISGAGESITIDTAGLSPGEYIVTGKLSGLRAHRLLASCRSSFRVLTPDTPPTLPAPAAVSQPAFIPDAPAVSQPALVPQPAAVSQPAAPHPVPSACSIDFSTAKLRAARLDVAAKACLDALAVRLAAEPASHVVLIGLHLAPETPATAAKRTVNSALYLVRAKHVDAARVEMRTAGKPGHAVETFVLEPGQVFAAESGSSIETNSLDEHSPEARRPRR